MLLEPETLQACLPGIETIERLDERNYTIVIAQKVGPLTVRFPIRAMLTKAEAPTLIELEGQRADNIGRAGEVIHRARIDLREKTGNVVEISYTVEAHIAGVPDFLGRGIIQARAKKVEADFTKALQERLDNLAK